MLTHIADVRWMAEWQLLGGDIERAREGLLVAMPPVVVAAARSATSGGAALHGRWPVPAHALRPAGRRPRTDTRSVNPRALRLASRALIAENGQFTVAPELGRRWRNIATELSLIGRRAQGEPIVRVRLRLGLPLQPTAPQPVRGC